MSADQETIVRDAIEALKMEGFAVLDDYSDPTKRAEQAAQLKAQPEFVLRSAMLILSASDRAGMPGVDPIRLTRDMVGNFYVAYGNGPKYMGVSVKPSAVNSAAKVRALMAKLEAELEAKLEEDLAAAQLSPPHLCV